MLMMCDFIKFDYSAILVFVNQRRCNELNKVNFSCVIVGPLWKPRLTTWRTSGLLTKVQAAVLRDVLSLQWFWLLLCPVKSRGHVKDRVLNLMLDNWKGACCCWLLYLMKTCCSSVCFQLFYLLL